MENVKVSLPDGSIRDFPKGSTVLDVARAIGPRLAQAALVGSINDQLVELGRPIESDSSIRILTAKDPETLEVYRHSTAHLCACAVQELYPETKLGIGPPTEDGFFYDFERPTRFSPDDLPKIEDKMREIAARDLPYDRVMRAKADVIAQFREQGESMKCELVEDKGGDMVQTYTIGPADKPIWIDFCRGPHVPSSGKLKAFKLLDIAGAYWKGDERNQQMQRIYGTAFFTQQDLDAHLKQIEEARLRDHRKLGRELDLFSIQEDAGPGLIFWHPKGGLIRKIMEDWMRDEYLRRGYDLVYTPHIANRKLWDTSGHTDHYSANMFPPSILEEDEKYQLKPMNCPGHVLIYKDRPRSYRDLPVRLGELGTVYRYERSGTMHGLMRVRGFTQDDAHIFCTPEQIKDEILGCIDFAIAVLRAFGFEKQFVELSTWDGGTSGKYMGAPETWAMAEASLKEAIEARNLEYKIIPDEAAFYGPKIDVKLVDAIGRHWQLSTVQFDWNLPERFQLEYTGADGHKHQPLMVHRALYGSEERFFGTLIEHYAGAFPLWLAPVQVVVLPIADRHTAYAKQVVEQLAAGGLRVKLDERSEKVNAKIREHQLQQVPYMLVVGDREAQNGAVSVRHRRHGDKGAQPVVEFLAMARDLVDRKVCTD